MRLFLVRHGETVDNVASLYAGSRDSALTNHGVLQYNRLAEHLASKLCPVAPPSAATPIEGEELGEPNPVPAGGDTASPVIHLFSSNLQRAVKTAEATRVALERKGQPAVQLRQLTELREKHFGTGEGQSFATGAKKEEPHRGAETHAALRARVDSFLEVYLLPLLAVPAASSEHTSHPTVIVVSHGITLSVLFRRLLERIADRTTFDPEAKQGGMPVAGDSREVTLSWSNTGYLEAMLSSSVSSADGTGWAQVSMHVIHVNATEHLKGLRKTRGGIGSARFDNKQKTIESFFTKKRKLADVAD